MLVSIIIPIRNEEKFIDKCLDSFLSQMQGREDIEILCVDGMSTDKTAGIIKEYTKRDHRIQLIENPAKIAPVAMNIGISKSQAEFIMVVGCHAEYGPDYIDKCIEVLRRTGADQVGGYMETVPGDDTAAGRAIAVATSNRFGIGNSEFRVGGKEKQVDTVPFGIFRREIFEKVGLYNERLVRNQDMEMSSRIRASGGLIIISPEIKLKYFNRSTYRGLWQQAFSNGLWNPYTLWLVGGGLRVRHFIPMVFVLSLVLLAVFSFFFRAVSIVLTAEVLLYCSIAVGAAVMIAKRKNVSAFLVFRAFATLHIGYGTGSLWGIMTIPFKFPRHKGLRKETPLADRK